MKLLYQLSPLSIAIQKFKAGAYVFYHSKLVLLINNPETLRVGRGSLGADRSQLRWGHRRQRVPPGGVLCPLVWTLQGEIILKSCEVFLCLGLCFSYNLLYSERNCKLIFTHYNEVLFYILYLGSTFPYSLPNSVNRQYFFVFCEQVQYSSIFCE